MSTSVKDVMTTQVIWVERDTPFVDIATALYQYRVSAFPVLNLSGQVIGVISEVDLLAKLALGGWDDRATDMIGGSQDHPQLESGRAIIAGDLMTAPPITIAPDNTIQDAALLMYRRRVKHLPVVSADNHLVGIISRFDVLSALNRPDKDIHQVALDEPLADPDAIGVT